MVGEGLVDMMTFERGLSTMGRRQPCDALEGKSCRERKPHMQRPQDKRELGIFKEEVIRKRGSMKLECGEEQSTG